MPLQILIMAIWESSNAPLRLVRNVVLTDACACWDMWRRIKQDKLQKDHAPTLVQGRVWTGKRALKNGLVDGLGGLATAISKAEDLAELSQSSCEYPTNIHSCY